MRVVALCLCLSCMFSKHNALEGKWEREKDHRLTSHCFLSFFHQAPHNQKAGLLLPYFDYPCRAKFGFYVHSVTLKMNGCMWLSL